MGVAHQLLGLGVVLGTDGVGAILVDALGHQAQVPHHGDARLDDAADGADNLLPALHLQGVGVALLHDADGRVHPLQLVALVGAEGHVHHHHGAAHTPHHALGMINHLVQRDGQRGHVAGHDVGGGVTHQDDVHPRAVHDLCHGIVIRGQHGNLFAPLLHLYEAMGSYFAIVF